MDSLSVKFTKMQRAGVVAEVAAAKGYIPVFLEAIGVTRRLSEEIEADVKSMLNGDQNGRQEERKDQDNPRREVNTKRQSGRKAKSKGR